MRPRRSRMPIYPAKEITEAQPAEARRQRDARTAAADPPAVDARTLEVRVVVAAVAIQPRAVLHRPAVVLAPAVGVVVRDPVAARATHPSRVRLMSWPNRSRH